MIRGAPHWSDRSRYFTQVNNPTDEQLRKTGARAYLETCGPTTAVNCLAAIGAPIDIRCPGPYRPQPEEVLADFFNDPRNYEALRAERNNLDPASLPGNRVPQYYPLGVREVFGARCEFRWGAKWLEIVDELVRGNPVQLCLKSPGHYLAAVAYDDLTDEIVYHDPWPARVGGDGFACRMARPEFEASLQPFIVVYDGGTK